MVHDGATWDDVVCGDHSRTVVPCGHLAAFDAAVGIAIIVVISITWPPAIVCSD
jgi:hypothetical protein